MKLIDSKRERKTARYRMAFRMRDFVFVWRDHKHFNGHEIQVYNIENCNKYAELNDIR